MATKIETKTAAKMPTKTPAKAAGKERRSEQRIVRERVLVTGAASSLGRVLCQRLHRTFDVIAVDPRPFPGRPKDVEHTDVDLRRKAAQTLIKKRRPDVVVHIGPLHDERTNVRTSAKIEGTATLLSLVELVRARKLIYLSSAMLYGPSPTSAAFLSEDSPLLAGQGENAMADAIAVDMMVQRFFWKRPETETVILRPVHIVGERVDTMPSRYLRLSRIPTLLGFDPMVQLVHEDDFLDAIMLAVRSGVRGVFNITGPTQAPLSRLIAQRRATHLPLPGFLLKPALFRARALGITAVHDAALDHLKYACLVDGKRAMDELAYVPHRTLHQALHDLG